jgi:hypothetical protein
MPKTSPYGEAHLGELGLITLSFAAAKNTTEIRKIRKKERAIAARDRERENRVS